MWYICVCTHIHIMEYYSVIKKDTIMDRNGMDLTEAEDINKRRQEYTEELTKNIFTTQIAMMV